MVSETDRLRRRLEKEQAKERESARKAQVIGAKLTQAARKEDTRRKILAGAWALDRAEKSETFRADMQRDLNSSWLVRDDDRELFDLAPLSTTEKEQRGVTPAPPRKNAGKEAKPANAPPSDSSASATAK